MTETIKVGIDDMAIYFPKLYLPIPDLAVTRNIEPEKLSQGLGLYKMAIPDLHEDAATMAANAVVELMDKNQIDPTSVGRIYLGTESALDGAKPTATYVLEMLQSKYAPIYGPDCFLNCDVVDLTFACIGGVDALHNTLDWIRAGQEDRIGIVVCSDFAKYELASPGEYTQGAGAIAMLVKTNPRLLAIEDHIGVATLGVHDFFKPRRKVTKLQIIDEVLELIGRNGIQAEDLLKRISNSLEVTGVLDDNDEILALYKETPVFDGPFSNSCYQNRIREAFIHFKKKAINNQAIEKDEVVLNRWARLVFHLPYAFHAKRVFPEIFKMEMEKTAEWESIANHIQEPQPEHFSDSSSFEKAYGHYLKEISQTPAYKAFVKEKMEKGQWASSEVGNMYACSIFLSLMGFLEADFDENQDLSGKHIGLFGYGSGSKSKVFEAQIQPEWKTVTANFKIRHKLNARKAIDYATYENLHRLKQKENVIPPQGEFILKNIGQEGVHLGSRTYEWIPSQVAAIW